MLSGGSFCVLSAGAVGSAGWGSSVAWRGSVVVVKPSISEVSSSACTPFLSKHRALSPGQVGSHTNIEGVCQLLSTVSLLQYGELVLPSVQSCYDGAGTVVVVFLGPCAVCTLNVVCSPGFAARIKAVQELNHLADISCVLFVRAFVNVGKKTNVISAEKRPAPTCPFLCQCSGKFSQNGLSGHTSSRTDRQIVYLCCWRVSVGGGFTTKWTSTYSLAHPPTYIHTHACARARTHTRKQARTQLARIDTGRSTGKGGGGYD